MNQQQQDKAAFFAQYYPQNVMRHDSYDDDQPSMDARPVGNTSHYLKLKPLTAITDEDAVIVCEIGGAIFSQISQKANAGKRLIWDYFDHIRCNVRGSEWIHIADFLRSRGYLIPFRNYSTDQILEMGWAKLRDL